MRFVPFLFFFSFAQTFFRFRPFVGIIEKGLVGFSFPLAVGFFSSRTLVLASMFDAAGAFAAEV